MRDFLRRLTAPPIFAGDEEKTSAAAVLNSLVWLFLATFLVFTLLAVPLVVVRKGASMLIIAVLVGIAGGAYALLRAGRVRVAGLVWLGTLWALATLITLFGGGVRSAFVALYTTIPVVAALILGRPGMFAAVGVSGVTPAALAGLELIGHLPQPYFPGPPLAVWSLLAMALIFTAAPLDLTLRSLRRALASAREQVAERMRAEAALRESERRARATFDLTFGFIGLLTPDGVVVEANRTALEFAGVQLADVVGKPFWETPWWNHSLEMQGRVRTAVRAAAEGKLTRFEATHRATDGALRILDVSLKPVADEAGRVVLLIPEGRDITEWKRAEEELRISELRFRRLFDGAADALFVHNEQGRIVDVNEVACNSVGYTRDELLRMSVPDVEVAVQPADLGPLWERIRSGQNAKVEGQHRRRDGSTFPVEIHIVPFTTGDRQLFFAAARDITDRKRADEALRESEEKFSRAFENAPVLMALTEVETGRFVEVNAEAVRLSGFSRAELIGKTSLEVGWLSPEDRARMLAIFREHGRVNGLELRFRAKGGQTLEVLYFNVKVTIRGKPHLLAIAQDITERTRAEEERQALHAKLIRQTQQLEAVRRVSAEITREMQMTALLKQIIQHAMHLVGGVNGSVLLWDDGRQRLVPGVWLGRTPVSHGVGIGLGEGVTGTVAAQRRGMIVNDYRTSSFARPAILEETEITAGMAEPLLYQDRLIGVINIDNGDTGRPFTEEHGELLRLFADQAAIAIENARLYDELKQSYNRLQSLAARAAEAEEGERRRLARELHDQVGQSLSALGLNLTILLGQHERMPDPASRCRLADSLTLVERTAAAIRGVMTDLRPGVLDDYGLVAALHGLGDEMAARTGIVVDVQAEELVPRLAASVENALFRIAQEALTNVMKHARASEVTVSLDAEDRVVRLVIADNGTGFELGRPQAPHDVRHWGLSAMAERALGVGGRCRVDSRPGKGTHVIVEVPR